ncbi:fimbrial protein [Erwinia amylovora]
MYSSINKYGLVNILSMASVMGMMMALNFHTAWAASCSDTNSCKVAVSFKGNYEDETCVVSINNQSSTESISLGVAAIAGNLDTKGAEYGSKDFNITLKNCPSSTTVGLRFLSQTTSDPETGNLVNKSGDNYSADAQIRLRDVSGTQLKVDDETSEQNYDIPENGADVTHLFTASYYAASSGVTPGNVNAAASIVLDYK